MNYSEFLKMAPEIVLVLALVVMFIADFVLHKSESKCKSLLSLMVAMMVTALCCTLCTAIHHPEPVSAFGGLYVASPAVNVMKFILAFGSLIVVLMAQPWVEKTQRLAGEFYMLLISTLLGMFIMMSSGNFLLFFL